ncbi:MAG: lysophospholipid acyltransferase family protein [Candidatus Omnitrophota bacterium]|jgi:1-acyl-sn-glycerol-3-phosphate acyltransferase
MWYTIFRAGCIIFLKLFFRLKIEGRENLPKKSNYIVVANHASFLDPLVVAAAIPAKVYCIASRSLYAFPKLKWALRKLDCLPTGASSECAIELLVKNNIVGLFPEGGISRDGRLREFKRGAALLAMKTGRPIVPCAISGAFEALPIKAKFPRFVSITVRICKPVFLLKEFEDVIDDSDLQEGITRIKNAIKEKINGK